MNLTEIETEKFYIQNIEIHKAKHKQESEILSWYLSQTTDHVYSSNLEIEKLNKFVQKIVAWYEIKYPNYLLEMKKNNDPKLIYVKDISKELDFEQLKFRLSFHERQTMNCYYRSSLWSSQAIEENIHNKERILCGVEDYKPLLGIKLKIEEEHFTREILFYADELGIIEKCNLHGLKNILKPFKGNTTLKRVLKELKKSSQKIDIRYLENCIKTHELDLELRDKIIFFAALSILSSQNNPLEYNYIRAISLITEYNDYYCRNLSTEEIQQLFYNPSSKENSHKMRKLKK